MIDTGSEVFVADTTPAILGAVGASGRVMEWLMGMIGGSGFAFELFVGIIEVEAVVIIGWATGSIV